MDIKSMSKRLRAAADALDALMEVDVRLTRDAGRVRDAILRKRRAHWTQRPENKARLARMIRNSVAAKRAARKARNGEK